MEFPAVCASRYGGDFLRSGPDFSAAVTSPQKLMGTSLDHIKWSAQPLELRPNTARVSGQSVFLPVSCPKPGSCHF